MAAVAPTAVMDLPTVNTTINYYLEPSQGGDVVHDIRGKEDDFDLDTHGFQLMQHRSAESSFNEEERVKTEVYAETAELLKMVTGASKVHPFSHIIRRQTWQSAKEAARDLPPEAIIKTMNPAMFAHVDQSYSGAHQVLRDNIIPQPDSERLSKSRFAIINVWRPIRHPVPREPLAVCDARTVPESDLREVFAVLPKKGQGTFDKVSKGDGFYLWNIVYNPSHRWYYASHMRPDEVLCIKCFDSKTDGRARRAPHSAFQVEGQDEGASARESIEVRCLVFWEDEGPE